MKNKYYKAVITYPSIDKEPQTQALYLADDTDKEFRRICDEIGNEPHISSGSVWFYDAVAAVITNTEKHIKRPFYTVEMSECEFKNMPAAVQKRFDYYRYVEENPLKLFEYPESKYIQVSRHSVPEYAKSVSDWLHHNCQPFDYIIEYTDNEDEDIACVKHKQDNGLYLKSMYKACPICGSKNIKSSRYNNLCPEALAGSAGYDDVCEDCGYSYRNVEIMS